MQEDIKYIFHPKLEILRCGGGVLMCYIMGNKISVFEESIDNNFSNFILETLKSNQAFSITTMIDFFSETDKKYNLKKILQILKKNGLVQDADKLNETQKKFILFINLTDIPDKKILTVSEEVGLRPPLQLINGFQMSELYKKIDENAIKSNQVVFVISDFQYKYKVSELNLHFFKKGVFWCPIIIDDFGGYIGPLIHSVPSGPCFSCYEQRIYTPANYQVQLKKSALLNIFLRVVFLEVLKIETNISPSQVIYSNLLEIDCWNCRSRKHYIYPNSDCLVCG